MLDVMLLTNNGLAFVFVRPEDLANAKKMAGHNETVLIPFQVEGGRRYEVSANRIFVKYGYGSS